MVLIEGLGWFVVEDLCAGCTGNWIDVWTAFALPAEQASRRFQNLGDYQP